MPDAVVDYDLANGKWNIIQQQNLLHERTRILYGTASSGRIKQDLSSLIEVNSNDNPWNELSEFYGCEQYDVPSHDGTMVPLTIMYSHSNRKENSNAGLLHGHGAYGELLDKRWRSELKSLLDRGWIIAYADVRCGLCLFFKLSSLFYFCPLQYWGWSFIKAITLHLLRTNYLFFFMLSASLSAIKFPISPIWTF